MPNYVVKPDRDQDFYVIWSDIVDSILCFGSRTYVDGAYTEASPERFARADRTGCSAKWPDPDTPIYGWDDDGFIYEQRGILPRANLRAACERLIVDEGADIGDLLTPFEDESAVRPT